MALTVWHLTVVGVVLAFIGTVFLYDALRRSSGRLKQSLTYLFLAAMFGPPSHLIVAYFGITGLDVTNELWNIMPVFFTLAMVFVVVSMKTLVELFESIVEVDTENKTERIIPPRIG
ncbi:MAG: hypothetical protein HYS81_05245 [Candidatus Aenigmatarchaeota archaeon]|nr:MAG: hypothetical protein HYS81_05245 [Candidatus Aenigmarchaeota archaeon]